MTDNPIEVVDLDKIRHSRETQKQKKSFVNLDGNVLGLEVNWPKEEFILFIYKEKRKNRILQTEPFDFYAGEMEFRRQLENLVLNYYRMVGRAKELPMYTKIELAIPMSHLNFHVLAKTLRRVLEKEVEYG